MKEINERRMLFVFGVAIGAVIGMTALAALGKINVSVIPESVGVS